MDFSKNIFSVYHSIILKRSILILAFICLMFCQACDSGSDGSGDAAQSGPLPPVKVQEISIEMDSALWDQIRNTARSPEILIPICGADAVESPYEYVPATVTIDGETFDNVGVRTKGWWGSINPSRPSLKIEFDEFVDDQSYHGIEKMTLNNNNHDFSRMHTCLAFKTFRRAGYPAPECGYAHVTVNGKDMGIYSSVEPVKDPFLEKWFDSDEGNLYESQISDFIPNAINRWERKNNDDTADDRSDIEAVMTALEAGNETLLDELDPLIDLDMFYKYWALEVLIAFWDGYSGDRNNCYIYNDPDSGKFVFIPWGTDDAFRSKSGILNIKSVGPLFANSTLCKRLYDHPVARANFIAELKRLYNIVWGSDILAREVRHTQKALQPYISQEFNPDFNAAVTELLKFMSSHPATVYMTLIVAGTPPDYPYDSTYRCYPDMSPVFPFTIEFSTTWGSSEFTGGTITEIEGGYFQSIPTAYPGIENCYSATASPAVSDDIMGYGNVKLQFLQVYYNLLTGPPYVNLRGDLGGIVLMLSSDRFLSGGSIAIENLTTCGMVIYISDYMNPATLMFRGLVIDGTLTLAESGMEVGDPVSGTFEGNLVLFDQL